MMLHQVARSTAPVEIVPGLAGQLKISEKEAIELWAEYFDMCPMTLQEMDHIDLNFDFVSYADCQRQGCAIGSTSRGPLGLNAEEIFFIVHMPTNLDVQQLFEAVFETQAPKRLTRVLVTAKDFSEKLSEAEQGLRAMDRVKLNETISEEQTDAAVLELSMAGIEATINPTVRLVDSTLYDALKVGASDIHFEVQQKSLHIKYRLDGVLQSIKRVDNLDTAHQVVSRIKILSDLDISEQRIPQDGRFRALHDHREIDFRVSIMPNLSGEDAVLRVLDRKHLTGQFSSLTLDTLSFDAGVKAFIRRASRLPYGLLLVTGPTGSGKTTTLYAAIAEINTGLDKIITIEDPIEYQLSGVLQIPVNEKKGLTFARGLRSVLRHDPDKIMVGEIRDSETAQIAVQAALTGHQVFTTVHANNVFDVIGRFSNMGVDSYSLVAALTGIMAQRLVRTVCMHCVQTVNDGEPLTEEIATLANAMGTQNIHIRKSMGCEHCRGTGYKGRAAIAEILPIDDEMKGLLLQQAPISTLKRLAVEKGFKSLRESSIAMALRGLTTFDEVDRVTPIQ